MDERKFVPIKFTGILKPGEGIREGLQVEVSRLGTVCIAASWTHARAGEEKKLLEDARRSMQEDLGVRCGILYIGRN